jgi:hypothetical protein
VESSILASLSEAGGTIYREATSSPFPLATSLSKDRRLKRAYGIP